MMVLSVKNIGRTFGGVRALDGVSFGVAGGEIIGIIGPNGAGKSTLLGIIAGRAPTSGEVWLSGHRLPPGRVHRTCRAGVARTFQIPRPFQTLTVADNVRAAARFGAAGRSAIIDDPITLCGLAGKADVLAESLTASEQRNLELARCLATAPTVLLLDEVGAGLSHQELAALARLIREIAAAGTAVVVVEHIMAFVLSVAHRIVAMDAGRVIADGSPDDVIRDEAVISAYLGTDGSEA